MLKKLIAIESLRRLDSDDSNLLYSYMQGIRITTAFMSAIAMRFLFGAKA
jgi:hypothetical protein